MPVLYVPSTNLVGRGCLAELNQFIKDLERKKALILKDKFLNESGIEVKY